ncbi:glycosyltransferase family 39 protein, partial [Alphaproteobacteria bacterium]|nr:glycosyltransferase family 39 protein [Alphaproteobacteria bacterium]
MTHFRKKNIFELNFQRTFLLLILIFIIRVISILNSPLGLSVDEAQYWDWSNNLEFGYFSKPPFIAWLIAFSTYFLGITEWSVRLSSPILHFLTTLTIWLITKTIYNEKIANFIAVTWTTIPLISFGSLIISTDTPLLLFWSLSILTLLKTLESNKIIWPIFLGISIGLGFLSKYAILYFVIILFFLILFNQRFKKNILKLMISILTFLIVCSPNLYWNYVNHLSTFNHTAYNANLNSISINYIEVIKFVTSQLIVCGLFFLIAYVFKVLSIKSHNKNEFLLICFSLPIIIIIIIQSLLNTSNANWAATAYPGVIILIGSFIYKKENKFFLTLIKLNLIFNFFIFLFLTKVFITGSLYPIELKSDPLRKLKGYPEITNNINSLIKKENPNAILFTRRNDITKFSYYLKSNNNKIKRYILSLRESPINHYEYFYNFREHSLQKEDV